jgi:hypothetical protein
LSSRPKCDTLKKIVPVGEGSFSFGWIREKDSSTRSSLGMTTF